MSRLRRRRPGGPSAERSRRRVRGPGTAGRAPAPAGDGAWTIETVGGLFLPGREADDAGDPEGVLALLAEAAATLEAERRPAEGGARAHREADRSSLAGDARSAWKGYLRAARLFHGGGIKGGFSASLSEAGMLLVRSAPPDPTAISGDVPHALLLGGLADATDHAVDALLCEGLPSVGLATEVHRRLTGLMVLATCAAAGHPLETGAVAIYNRVVRPFEERHGVGPETLIGDAKAIAAPFMGLALLSAAIGAQEGFGREGVPPTREEVEELGSHAVLAFPGATRSSMLPWLGSYLRDRRGADWATDAHLLAAADR